MMDQLKKRVDKTSIAGASNVVGTPLVHYGLTSERTHEGAVDQDNGSVAVLVCHGMGQQVRYETIGALAEAIRTQAQADGGTVAPVEVHLSRESGGFLARAEVNWTDNTLIKHSVHVYEAYWAPLTEGRVSYWDTVKFLFEAAWNGLKFSRPFRSTYFERWMFDGRKTMRIGRATFLGIVCVLLFVAAQVVIIGYVFLELAQQYKDVLSAPLPTVAASGFLRACLRWLAPFFPGHEILLHSGIFGHAWWGALGSLMVWIFLILEALLVRYFIIEYVGDVAAYVSPYKDSKFDEIRHQIQNVGLEVGKVIYGFGTPLPMVPRYRKVIVAGHSLGSVLAYDTLNALINLDNVSGREDRRDVVGRTRALITFGSPLDKTAFIFRMQANNDQDWIREQLAASVQPLIVSYDAYRPPSFDWINIWSRMDIISGELNFYDDPARPFNVAPCVQNKTDPEARFPLLAHVEYWNNKLLRQELYRFVS